MDDVGYWIQLYSGYAFVFFFCPTPAWLLWTTMGIFDGYRALLPFLLLPYCGTMVWVAAEAARLRFIDYPSLLLVKSPKSALIGCMLSWHICFPVFLYNRHLVIKQKVHPRRDGGVKPTNNALDALVAMQVMAIIMAMALPSCMQSPQRANEAKAVMALREYVSAQKSFARMNRSGEIAAGATKGDEYCDNFRNLYYGLGKKHGKQLRLIPKGVADAFGASFSETPNAAGESTPYRAFVFVDDPYVAHSGLGESRYGLFALPVRAGYDQAFWVGEDGNVRMRWLTAGEGRPPAVDETSSPLHPAGKDNWVSL